MSPPFFPTLRKRLYALCVRYCVVVFVLMLGIVLMQVFTRNILGLPMPWAEEASIYLMISLGLFGSAFVMIEKGQLRVDMIINKFPAAARYGVTAMTLTAQIAFAALIIYFSFGSLEYAGKVQAISLGTSMWLPYVSIPVAFGLMLLEMLIQLAESLYAIFAADSGGTE